MLNLFVLVTQAVSDTLTANGISIVFLKLPRNFDIIEHTIVSTFKLCIASSAFFFIKLIKYAQFQSKQLQDMRKDLFFKCLEYQYLS